MASTASFAEEPTLKEAFQKHFLVGTALAPFQFTEQNTTMTALITSQFNAISPENALKWQSVHPQPERFQFDAADRYSSSADATRCLL